MKKSLLRVMIVLFVLSGTAFIFAQDSKFNLSEKIKNDEAVIKGKLKNGLTYYIRANKKPEKRAELRLVVNAGSILEDDNQQGLAHFTEHMAFNGTKNFKKQEIINFLEGIGMRFGPELNASTSFDETIYMLQLPTEKQDVLGKGFKILREWASNISFENEEIDKERGVIVEEWRIGRGAQARIQDKQIPVILKDSHYAERLPVGKKEIIESFKYETIKKFYKDWYRPDLMAVIAVGDFDVKEIEKVIKQQFGSIPAVKKPRPRKTFTVPEFKETFYTIESDKELGMSRVSVLYKNKPYATVALKDFKEDALSSIFSGVMSDRLEEERLRADAPFVAAYISSGLGFVRSLSPAQVTVVPKDNNIEKGLKAALLELERAKKFGITETELDRQKKEYLRSLEESVKEKDKKESSELVDRLIENYLQGETYPSEETNYELGKKIVPAITLADINDFIKRTFKDENRVVAASLPDKAEVKKPTKELLENILINAGKEKIEAYVDKTLNEDLIPFEIKPGTITSEKKDELTGTTELKLSNGALAVLKPTDFKNDEILYTAFSDGGTSVYEDKDEMNASIGSTIIAQSGVGKFSQPELSKFLTGKIVNIIPYVSTYSEGLRGKASVKDIETLFKLNYLYFTSPRKDTAAFKSLMSMIGSVLKNRDANPEANFADTTSVTLYNYHKRALPITAERLNEINYDTTFKFYKDRFADASDFTFVFVGNFKPDDMKPFIEKYIASLPALNRNEKWRDIGLDYKKGAVQKEVKKGIEQKGKVQMYYSGEFEWSPKEEFILQSLTDVMTIKLREAIREEKGGTYGIGIMSNANKIPKGRYLITLGFGCKPERAEELSKETLTQIDSVINYPVKESYISKVKEAYLKAMEKDLKENNSWLGWIQDSYKENTPLSDVLSYKEKAALLTPQAIQNAAKKFFNKDNFIKVVLYPEK
jgi:zinc protease